MFQRRAPAGDDGVNDERRRGIDGQRAMAALAWMAGVAALLAFGLQALGWWLYRPRPQHEPVRQIRRLYDGSAAYFEVHNRFPASTPLHREVGCDERPSPSWSEPTWQALQFEIEERHWFSFQYDSSGSGASAQFTASAFGDLDCDGVASTFVRFGSVREIGAGTGERLDVVGSSGLYIANEAE